jgi:hypothetical protein
MTKKNPDKEFVSNVPLRYKVEFKMDYSHQARTLEPENGFFESTGWTIDGEIHEDYFEWINEFEAFHPKYGRVCGDFETVVKASSKKAYEQFIKDHPYQEWDYWDI